MTTLAEKTANEVNGVGLREMIVPGLKKAGAWRNHPGFTQDTLHQAIKGDKLAESIISIGFPGDSVTIAVELWELAKTDTSLRLYVNYTGGNHAKPWLNHEWSLPPVE